MSKKQNAWYEITEKPIIVGKSIQCDYFGTVISLQELEKIQISCPYSIVKFKWQIRIRYYDVVLEGSHTFEGEGVKEFMLKDALPLETIAPYETEEVTYLLETGVTLSDGNEVEGFRVFRAYLAKGGTTKDLPRFDLLEKLNAIPIARPGMTEEQLRQICLDYMNLQCEFPFKLKEDYTYTVVSQNQNRRLLADTVYGGMPYVTRGGGNLYRIAEFFDPETGYIDTKGDIFEDMLILGNACSGAACMAWGRVITSAYLGYSRMMTQANGFLPVGPYRYSDPEISDFRPQKLFNPFYSCREICDENGEQTMFESYAMLKPADGIGCCGHVRMSSALPIVVRNEDGTIDGEKSFVFMSEQVCYVPDANHLRTAPDGTRYTACGLVDRKYSFKELFNTNYIPFTFAEFIDPSRVELPRLLCNTETKPEDSVISSNYTIADVFCEANGKKYVFRNEHFFCKEVWLRHIFPKEALVPTAKISVRLYNGETLEVNTKRWTL